MKTAVLIAIFAVLAGIGCSTKPAIIPAKYSKWSKAAVGPLTEADIAEFVRLLPSLDGALQAAGWKVPMGIPGSGPARYEIDLVESMNVPGVDDSLKAAGSSWSAMRSLMYRIWAAMNAKKTESDAQAVIAQRSGDTSAAFKEFMKETRPYLVLDAQIPEGNKELVWKHLPELMAISAMGHWGHRMFNSK